MKFAPRAILAIIALAVSATFTSASTDRSFQTSPSLSLEIRTLIRLLEEVHYNREAVKPEDYSEVIPGYMKEIDGQRLFFLQSDLSTFTTRYNDGLYWNITSMGRIDAAYQIFNIYEERATARINWVFEALKQDFDLNGNEQYQFDRSKSEWPVDPAAADALWLRRLKFEIVSELLNDKTIDEAKEKITKRYTRMLKNLHDLETSDLAEMFLTSITKLYDPHSTYFSADTYEDFGIQMRLQLVGIGALLGVEDDLCTVREVITGGPADLDNQLGPNDEILAVAQGDEEPVEVIGMKLRRIVEMIRGEKGTEVRLTVHPADAADSSVRKVITLNRDIVNLDSARARGAIYEVPNSEQTLSRIGVVTLPAFYGPDPSSEGTQNSATDDVAELITKLTAQSIDGLVLDMRDNGGGLLSEAISLTGLFIQDGPVVQVRSYYGDVKVDEDEDKSVKYSGPLAVLVSRFSASASEIVAGALQNYGRAILVGDSSTHGKGTVQTVVEMKNVIPALARSTAKTGATKLTVQKFYLPSGSSTQRKGVIPDIPLPSIDDYLPIGESDLPHALVWDEIPSSYFAGRPLEPTILTPLREASRNRQETLEEFSYLNRSIDWFKSKQEEKSVSLNLEERREQKTRDEAFKEAMDAKLEELAKTDFTKEEYYLGNQEEQKAAREAAKAERAKKAAADALASKASEGETPGTDSDGESLADVEEIKPQLDIHLREALRVVSDAIEMAHQPEFAATPPPLALAPLRTGS